MTTNGAPAIAPTISPAIAPVITPGPQPLRVAVLGATGTIGKATLRALVADGHAVVGFVRSPSDDAQQGRSGAEFRVCDVTDPVSLARDGFRGERFDALVSCLASRTGRAADAWAIDHDAFVGSLATAKAAGVRHVVLLSAICVQKPRLAFQHAKLAAEAALVESGLTYSIVRPTAFFKSLSGQVERVRRGKPFLVFGDGRLTACKPISDDDLGRYLARCLRDPALQNRVLPIGGPGEAITPLQQGEALFAILGRAPRFRHVPVALLTTIRRLLAIGGKVSPTLAAKAELAGIGLYYATESMLILDLATGRYDADATPSTGTETLADHYARRVRGETGDDRGDHAVF